MKIRSKKQELTIISAILLLLLVIQCLFSAKYSNFKPDITIVPTPPSQNTAKAFSFGDDQFYFRINAFKIQNMGNTYGRNTPLAKYDYSKLYYWLKFIDSFDTKSNYLASLSAYYFSSTPVERDTIHIIKFLEEHASYNLEKNWWWLYQATYIANFIYKDSDLAIRLATKLKDTSPSTAPIWTKRMAGILLANNKQDCESLRVMVEVLNNYEKNKDNMSKEQIAEIDYMLIFIKEIEKRLQEKNIDINECLQQR